MGNYFPGSYDVGWLQDKNLRETFQEQLNTEQKNLTFDKAEGEWNNFWKINFEVADGIFRK